MNIAEKSRLSREISGLLFISEATALNIPNRARILCLRLKNQAHFAAHAGSPPTWSDNVFSYYDELESLLREPS